MLIAHKFPPIIASPSNWDHMEDTDTAKLFLSDPTTVSTIIVILVISIAIALVYSLI